MSRKETIAEQFCRTLRDGADIPNFVQRTPPMSDQSEKLHIGGVDQDDERCLRCGSPFLDTGWECTECGYDNRDHYYKPSENAHG